MFQTKPQLAGALCEQAAGWEIPRAPVLGDEAYGKNCELRGRLDDAGIEYVLSVNADAQVYDADTVFSVPERGPARVARRPARWSPTASLRAIAELAASLDARNFQTLVYRTRDGHDISSRFALLRVIAAHPVERDRRPHDQVPKAGGPPRTWGADRAPVVATDADSGSAGYVVRLVARSNRDDDAAAPSPPQAPATHRHLPPHRRLPPQLERA